jgi:hypothetical protein
MGAASNALAGQMSDRERRENDRVDVALWSRIRSHGRHDHAMRICNVSADGVMAMTPCPVMDQDRVQIELPAIGWHDAVVVWSLGDRIGAAFTKPIERELFERFVSFQH